MKRSLLFALLLSSCSPKPVESPKATIASIQFVEDDYEAARARARASHKPLFVDVWAPWCHTCLSLRAYVLRDPALARFADRFVFLAVDTEKQENAAFLAEHPIEAWPTLFVLDPETGQPILRWLGAATVDELELLLDDTLAGGTSAAEWVKGNRAAAEGKTDEAIAAYRAALAATTDPKRRARIVDALVMQTGKVDPPGCAGLALEELPKLPAGTSRANVALAGFDCAHTSKDVAKLAALQAAIEKLAHEPGILADDRSGLFEVLVDHHQTLGDKSEVERIARDWATFLEGEAAKAKGPAARTVFDAHRMLAYLALGEPEKALPMLAQSEKDFPDDYNPPARLAKVNLVLHRLDEARAAIDRSLSKAYGPRKLRLYLLAADIDHARGDSKAERTRLEDARAHAKTLGKLSSGAAKLLAQIEARLAKL